ncbi:sulfur carrier protein ThiS [Kushneria sinocarnis]|uniref:Sulfur carrier protein ThiS n=1 Tax=Kushneria sinocarnis TaxID=595502 RepID=A0A420X0P5_9GAMM|nr:sulfur carrier protein ThiS [Kushneria sinocarnis]RKR07421.1 sulfur carrier protein ThiS [Kushneria sinocarnis]
MQLTINGESRAVDQAATVAELIDRLGLANRRLAVELNEMIVPRSRHAETALSEGDHIEIVHAIGGG